MPAPPPAPVQVAAPPSPKPKPLDDLRDKVAGFRRKVGRGLLYTRYAFGYLALGFFTSVPISMGQKIGPKFPWEDAALDTLRSIAYGAVCLVPFLALIPMTNIDWSAMRVPEYQLFDLKVTRLAIVLSGIACLMGYVSDAFGWLVQPQLTWIVCSLMVIAWVRIRVQMKLFPDFYVIPEDAVVLPPARAPGKSHLS